jgi:hypothetical protein
MQREMAVHRARAAMQTHDYDDSTATASEIMHCNQRVYLEDVRSEKIEQVGVIERGCSGGACTNKSIIKVHPCVMKMMREGGGKQERWVPNLWRGRQLTQQQSIFCRHHSQGRQLHGQGPRTNARALSVLRKKERQTENREQSNNTGKGRKQEGEGEGGKQEHEGTSSTASTTSSSLGTKGEIKDCCQR